MRTCGTCNACCIAPELDAIQKPCWSRCPHLSGGREGCSIYDERPEDCRSFSCIWLDSPEMPAAFRPDKSKIMLVAREERLIQAWELGKKKFLGSRVAEWIRPRMPTGWRIALKRRSDGRTQDAGRRGASEAR